CRYGQRRLDAGAGRGDGRGKECRVGQEDQHAAGHRAAGLGELHCRRAVRAKPRSLVVTCACLLRAIKVIREDAMTGVPRRAVLSGAAAATLAASASVRAQPDWPKGPIHFIVPFPPGGGTDPIARIIAAKLGETAGWRIVVENKP